MGLCGCFSRKGKYEVPSLLFISQSTRYKMYVFVFFCSPHWVRVVLARAPTAVIPTTPSKAAYADSTDTYRPAVIHACRLCWSLFTRCRGCSTFCVRLIRTRTWQGWWSAFLRYFRGTRPGERSDCFQVFMFSVDKTGRRGSMLMNRLLVLY